MGAASRTLLGNPPIAGLAAPLPRLARAPITVASAPPPREIRVRRRLGGPARHAVERAPFYTAAVGTSQHTCARACLQHPARRVVAASTRSRRDADEPVQAQPM